MNGNYIPVIIQSQYRVFIRLHRFHNASLNTQGKMSENAVVWCKCVIDIILYIIILHIRRRSSCEFRAFYSCIIVITQTSHLVRPSKNVENTPKIELSTMSFSAS